MNLRKDHYRNRETLTLVREGGGSVLPFSPVETVPMLGRDLERGTVRRQGVLIHSGSLGVGVPGSRPSYGATAAQHMSYSLGSGSKRRASRLRGPLGFPPRTRRPALSFFSNSVFSYREGKANLSKSIKKTKRENSERWITRLASR